MTSDALQVFFSYSRADSFEFANHLADDLKAAGTVVWIDQHIEPGRHWDRAVKDALINCHRMLVILSPSSVESDNVLNEIDLALEKKKAIIPVLYMDCEPPLFLRRVQYIDFRTNYARGLQDLLKALQLQQRPQGVTPTPREVAEVSQPAVSDAEKAKGAEGQTQPERKSKKSTGLSFDPKPEEEIELFNTLYKFTPDPAKKPPQVWHVAGKRASVYRLQDVQSGEFFALKVFEELFRQRYQLDLYGALKGLDKLRGMKAAERRIVRPTSPVANKFPDLAYAMLMPWVTGKTWSAILSSCSGDGAAYSFVTGAQVARQFLSVMATLEAKGMAHAGISPRDVLVELQPIDIQLIDLEDFFHPDRPEPPFKYPGSPGYKHPAAQHLWCPEGDRYSTAIVAAEMLLVADPVQARKAAETGLFEGNAQSAEARKRFKKARSWLEDRAPKFGALLEVAWYSDRLGNCPRISDLLSAVKEI